MDIQVVAVHGEAAAILEQIPEHTEAVYIGPLVRLPDSEVQTLIDGLNQRHLPTYASEGRKWVERGAFTSLVPGDDEQRRLRRTALYIQDVLAGEDPATFSTVFEPRAELVINMSTARAIGVWPRFEVMTEAELQKISLQVPSSMFPPWSRIEPAVAFMP